MKASKEQKRYIHINTPTSDIKEEYVQWATNDNSKVSCNDLSFEQANRIIEKLGGRPFSPRNLGWGRFEKNNPQHHYILSLLHQMGWTHLHPKTQRYVANLERFGQWLQSHRSPVQKPLMKMGKQELSKIITALEGMV